nr:MULTISPECIES: DNA repair protein RadA [Pseudomonas]
MPIKPRPFTFVCDECGWKKTVAPRSDALRPGDWFARCPKCGSEALSHRSADVFDRTVAEWLARLRRF